MVERQPDGRRDPTAVLKALFLRRYKIHTIGFSQWRVNDWEECEYGNELLGPQSSIFVNDHFRTHSLLQIPSLRMVSFVCDACQSAVKKPKVDQHYARYGQSSDQDRL